MIGCYSKRKRNAHIFSSGKILIDAVAKPTKCTDKRMKRKRYVQYNKYKLKIGQTMIVKLAMYICTSHQMEIVVILSTIQFLN